MRSVIIVLFLAIIFGAGGAFLWRYYGGFSEERKQAIAFIDVYSEYSEVASRVESLVHLPGSEGNSNRAELLSLLESILTKEMSSERRDELARLAYANLDIIKKEIDSAQSAQATLYEVLQKLDNESKKFPSIELQKKAMEVVRVARKRAELSARITSILSEVNDETHLIITRILADKGELTQSHIIFINESTQKAETRFETLERLYSELLASDNEAERLFKDFIETAI